MPHLIEELGIKILIPTLEFMGHKVERTGGTFDITVDGIPTEVRTKRKKFSQLDFISLTQNQFSAAQKEKFNIYLVCDLDAIKPEIYKINSEDLLNNKSRIITSYEYGRPVLTRVAKLIN